MLTWRFCIYLIIIVFPLLWRSFAWAEAAHFSILYYRPAFTEGDFVSALGSRSLKPDDVFAASQVMYGYKPLKLVQNNTTTNIVHHLLIQNVAVGYGVTPWWQTEMDFPVVWFNRFIEPVLPTPAPTNKLTWGDLMLRQRFTVFQRAPGRFGLVISPFVNFPTGEDEYFISDRIPTGGAVVAVDSQLGEHVAIALNVGYEVREKVVFDNDDLKLKNRFLLKGAIGFLQDRSQITLEVITFTPADTLFKSSRQTPTEGLVEFDYKLGHSYLCLQAGAAVSLVGGMGTPLFRTFAGISWQRNIRPGQSDPY